jgi:uncharacterized protein YggE
MKIKTLAIGATIAAAALFAACGGGDGDSASNTTGSRNSTSNITTQHGLSVAALFSNNSASGDKSNVPAAAPSEGQGGGASSDSAVTNGNTGVGADGVAAGEPQAVGNGKLGITVSGFGLATADPDAAVIDLYFSRYSYCCDVIPQPAPDANGSTSSGSGSSGAVPPIGVPEDVKPPVSTGTVEPITEADLQPVIDALTGAGIARDDIVFTGQTYSDPYSSSATLEVTVGNIDNADSALTAAQNAAANLSDVSMSSNVSYTLNDCKAIEQAALDAAVTDANERGQQLADALHVGKGNIIGAEDYSWSPSGSTCSSGGYPYPIYYAKDAREGGATGSSNQVQVVAQISVTFELQ